MNFSSPNKSRTYDFLITRPDALPLSHKRPTGAKAIKLDSCDKHPAYCCGWNVSKWNTCSYINVI